MLRGHKVKVITSNRGLPSVQSKEELDGVDVIRYPENGFLLEAPIIPKLARDVLVEDFDVLHIHGMTPTVTDLGVLFAKIRGKPVLVTYHNDAETDIYGIIGRIAAKIYTLIGILVMSLADCVVSTSRSYYSTSPVLKRINRKVRIIPMGVDLHRYHPLESNKLSDHKKILFVGQLKDYKGVDILLNAIKLANHHNPIDISACIVGNGYMYHQLTRKARALEVDKRVTFRRNVDDKSLIDLYHECDLLVLPSVSRREAFGIVLLEAMASGKPVIASNIPGVREVVSECGGSLVEKGKPEALAKAMLEILYDGNTYSKMSSHALKKVGRFDWDTIVDQYEKIMCELAH